MTYVDPDFSSIGALADPSAPANHSSELDEIATAIRTSAAPGAGERSA
ncbi:hypothetical protein JNN96_29840 [Mycobacterium sp. DSM 3803]|nr:hypothetical protein [Mycobacterium sp. DSM 3803]